MVEVALRSGIYVMDLIIVMMVQMNQSPSAPLHVQQICLFVLMAYNVLVCIESAMEWLNVRMDLMNLKLFAPLHVQLICLLALMALNVFLNLKLVTR